MTTDAMDDAMEAARKLRALKDIPDPSEVVIVRPKYGWTSFVSQMFGFAIGMLIRGAVISFAATHVSFVPDFGYWESVWIGILGAYIFRNGGSWNHWTRGWGERHRAAYDRFLAMTKKAAMKAAKAQMDQAERADR